MKLLKLVLPFLLFTLLSNSTFARVSHQEKELKKITNSARKFFGIKAGNALKSVKNFKWKNADKIDGFWADVVSPKRRNHILNGDATGVGHLWPGKSTFPKLSGSKLQVSQELLILRKVFLSSMRLSE